jgi:hypothetical protein
LSDAKTPVEWITTPAYKGSHLTHSCIAYSISRSTPRTTLAQQRHGRPTKNQRRLNERRNYIPVHETSTRAPQPRVRLCLPRHRRDSRRTRTSIQTDRFLPCTLQEHQGSATISRSAPNKPAHKARISFHALRKLHRPAQLARGFQGQRNRSLRLDGLRLCFDTRESPGRAVLSML